MGEAQSAVILVVEDEPLVRLFAEEVLAEDGGYRVVAANNAHEALAVLSARPDVRLVFTDINMPGSMSGLDLAHRVHAVWPAIGLLVTSGAGLDGALPPGARFLEKPVMPMVLVATVGDLLAERHGAMQPQPVAAL